jgi:tRNA/rRNA methyltransferase
MEKMRREAPGGVRGEPEPELAPPVVILVEPQLGENIGQAARAMANFGLRKLRLVAPRDGWPNERASANGIGAGDILDAAEVFATLGEAVADLHYIGATTARVRDISKPVLTPESAIREVAARTGDGGQACGILFGRERSGLNNDEIALAHALIIAPVNPLVASLNLAQAVLLIGYEWRKLMAGDRLGRATQFDGPAREGLDPARCNPATAGELLHLFEHIEAELTKAGFFKTDDKRPTMIRNIRTLFLKASLTSQEVRTLRGMVVALTRPRPPQTEASAPQGGVTGTQSS